MIRILNVLSTYVTFGIVCFRNGAKRLHKGKSGGQQGRLDSFFKALPSTPAMKRKSEIKKEPASAKKTKGKGSFKKGK